MRIGLAVLAMTLALPVMTWAEEVITEHMCWRFQTMKDVVTWTPKTIEGKEGQWGELRWESPELYQFSGEAQFFGETGGARTMLLVQNTTQEFSGYKGVRLRLFWTDGIKRPGRWQIWGAGDPPFRSNGVLEPIECP